MLLKIYSPKTAQSPSCFIAEFYLTFKEQIILFFFKIISFLYNLFKKKGKGGMLPKSFNEVIMILLK